VNRYHQQVEEAVRATELLSPSTYSWFGKRTEQLAPSIRRSLSPKTARSYLRFNLRSRLYADFYCRGIAAPTAQEAPDLSAAGVAPFVEALSAANSGSGYWEGGWEARTTVNGKVAVRKGGLELWARPEDCLLPEGGVIASGTQLRLRFPKEYLSISPGFYTASSDEHLDPEDSQQTLVRMYWNLTAEGAVTFVRYATLALNRTHLPFRLKVVNDPSRFTRCDAAVVYVPKSYYEVAAEVLEKVYPKVTSSLRQDVPALTKTLASGVGLAEDPGQGESFGLHRCQLLAEGMIRAHEQGKKSAKERLQAVADRFAEDGLDLETPFLNPDSSDDYGFRPRRFHQRVQPSRGTVGASHVDPNSDVLLSTADSIGQRLSREAVWHGDRCNWLGAEPVEQSRMGGQPGLTYRALGPELYSGTSGVALFLAELHGATGDAAARRTALGAIRQSLAHVDAVPSTSRLGLYTGWIGIAFAAARVGVVLGEEELLGHAIRLLRRSAGESRDRHEFDLMSGHAGAIAALVVLCDVLNEAPLLDFAAQLGDELLKAADEIDAGHSWESFGFPRQRNLTGFSHGTAGVGYALLELFRATDDSRYLRAAQQAFRYERYWFDATAGNWPDFREEPARGRRGKRPLSFATSWCHGAPGIALSRLRAYEVVRDETCKDEATTALRTTREMVERTLRSRIENFSLCHGLAGNAEVLLYGYQVLGQDQAPLSELAHHVAYDGIQRYATRGHSWPCGTGGGETPSLMLGLAGIGHFYLRLRDPAMPSVLILQRENFSAGSRGSAYSRNMEGSKGASPRRNTAIVKPRDAAVGRR
jgi:hypothetical protein